MRSSATAPSLNTLGASPPPEKVVTVAESASAHRNSPAKTQTTSAAVVNCGLAGQQKPHVPAKTLASSATGQAAGGTVSSACSGSSGPATTAGRPKLNVEIPDSAGRGGSSGACLHTPRVDPREGHR